MKPEVEGLLIGALSGHEMQPADTVSREREVPVHGTSLHVPYISRELTAYVVTIAKHSKDASACAATCRGQRSSKAADPDQLGLSTSEGSLRKTTPSTPASPDYPMIMSSYTIAVPDSKIEELRTKLSVATFPDEVRSSIH